MICTAVQQALSVASDNELLPDPALTENEVAAHLDNCATCQAFASTSQAITQRLRMDAVGDVPDIAAKVAEQLPTTVRRSKQRFGQGLVAAAAIGAIIATGAFDRSVPGNETLAAGSLLDVAAVNEAPNVSESAPETTGEAPVRAEVVIWSPSSLTKDVTDQITSNVLVSKSSVAALSTIDITDSGTSATTSIEVLSFDPATYPEFINEASSSSFSSLGGSEAVLSETAASERNLTTGASLVLSNGTELRVAAVVPDTAMADADVAMVQSTVDSLGATSDTFILLDADTNAEAVEEMLSRASSDLPLVVVDRSIAASARLAPKTIFRAEPDLDEEAPDLEWLRANIRRSTIPVLGEIRCHRDVNRALAGAMSRLKARGLEALIDPESTFVCFDRHADPAQGDHWRHSAGLAIDLNLVEGEQPTIDRRLRNIMAKFGFVWGGEFLVPQPSHFEYVGPFIEGTAPPGETATLTGTNIAD